MEVPSEQLPIDRKEKKRKKKEKEEGKEKEIMYGD